MSIHKIIHAECRREDVDDDADDDNDEKTFIKDGENASTYFEANSSIYLTYSYPNAK